MTFEWHFGTRILCGQYVYIVSEVYIESVVGIGFLFFIVWQFVSFLNNTFAVLFRAHNILAKLLSLWCLSYNFFFLRESATPFIETEHCNLLFQQYTVYSGLGGSVGTATGYGLDGLGIKSRWGGRDFPHLSRMVLGPTQRPVQWVLGLSRG